MKKKKNNDDWMLDSLQKTIETTKQKLKLYKYLKRKVGIMDYNIYSSDNIIYIGIKDFDDLAFKRSMLRQALGKWEDKLKSIMQNYGGMMNVEWQGIEKFNVKICLRMICDPENMPEELKKLKPDCHIEKEVKTETSYRYVCEVKND